MAIDRTPQQQRKADIERAQMLLAKAERSEHDEERDAFNEAAEKLMIRLGIDRALIDAQATDKTTAEKVITHKWYFDKGDPLMEANFLMTIAQAYGMQSVQWTGRRSSKTVEVFGHESDLANLITIYTSLRQQADTGRVRWERVNDSVYDAKLDKDYPVLRRLRRGYMLGFSQGAATRIGASVRKVTEEATSNIPGTALVLADRQAVVQSVLRETYPKLGKARSFTADGRGSHAGYRDGQQASTGERGIGGRAALGGR
jgi:hypothetical protein